LAEEFLEAEEEAGRGKKGEAARGQIMELRQDYGQQEGLQRGDSCIHDPSKKR
jgi:hypothetical protein